MSTDCPSPSGRSFALTDLPALGICGFSGAGKTTLIERLIPSLMQQGLSVAVVKHDAHGLDVDHPGKDSDRFFRAGADVLAQGPQERFYRAHCRQARELPELLAPLCLEHDVVFVEGHKGSPLPKVWLLNGGQDRPPAEAQNVLAALTRQQDRHAAVLSLVRQRLARHLAETPVFAGVLIGGQSRRMGRPKHLIRRAGRTWLEHTVEVLAACCHQVVLVGEGTIPKSLLGRPRLPDVPDVRGPLAGMLAAMRWAPWASWLFAACDLPAISDAAVRWLLDQRRPGVWATIPAVGRGMPEPLLAHYDFRCRLRLEGLIRRGVWAPSQIAADPKVVVAPVPPALADAWENCNCPADIAGLQRSVSRPDSGPPSRPARSRRCRNRR